MILRKIQIFANLHVMNSFLNYAKEVNNRYVVHYLQYQPKKLADYIKEFDFLYSDITDEKSTILLVMLIDFWDVYSQHNFNLARRWQTFHVTLEPKAELERQGHRKVPYI